ncbi:MAG TPA: BrnT family toxin [Lacunisphaera sp.]|nr:BrnT family toxin [Lacunisphaera sp.]
MRFSWDRAKERLNAARHGVDFTTAQRAFADPKFIILFDAAHSTLHELRWWLLGRVGSRILLVRYTHRPGGIIRLIGAGYWREGRDYYETHWKNQIT